MCITLVVRDAIARLWHNVGFVAGAVLCVFLSHTLFPFQLQRALSEVGWCYVAAAFGMILMVLWQMRRNEFLRRVASPDPTKATGWDTAFVLRLAIFVLIPLLTLFAAQFPDTGGVLIRWLEPVRKFLP
jgi:high-affinity Fe2+/Pb2+ permease